MQEVFLSPGSLDAALVDEQVPYEDFAERLIAAASDIGLPTTQAGLGRAFGVSQPTARDWMKGYALPGISNAVHIAEQLGVCVEWLLTGRGPRFPGPSPSVDPLLMSKMLAATRNGIAKAVELANDPETVAENFPLERQEMLACRLYNRFAGSETAPSLETAVETIVALIEAERPAPALRSTPRPRSRPRAR